LALAAWLCPFSTAYGQADADGVENPRLPDSTGQLAQNAITEQVAQDVIVVPSRVINIPRGQTVLERSRPELDPLGVRAGGFIIFPSLSVGEEYNDNIFSTDTGTVDDFITRITPRVRVNSNWNNHALNFFTGGDIALHHDNSAEDYEDFNVGATGRLDIQRDSQIRARVEYQNLHVERGDPDDTGSSEPTEYDVYIGQLEGFRRFNRVSLLLGGFFERQDYQDDVATNNDDRDRTEIQTSLRVGYKMAANYEGFVRATYIINDYDDLADVSLLDKDSQGIELDVGATIDFGGIVFGDFFAGYMKRDYDASSLGSTDGPSLGADITWNVTPLTTLIGTIQREIRESTTGDGLGNFASGRFVTTAGVEAQHELLRNLLLGANISYTNDDYQGIDREDNTFRFGLNGRYMLYRNLYLRAGYSFRQKDSDVAGSDYIENILFARLQAQY
jgi:hypothetical protein